jgi:hypothetical protein
MPQAQTMSLEEKLAISNKALALWEAGDTEGYKKLMKKLSIPPYLENVACSKGFTAGGNEQEIITKEKIKMKKQKS